MERECVGELKSFTLCEEFKGGITGRTRGEGPIDGGARGVGVGVERFDGAVGDAVGASASGRDGEIKHVDQCLIR